MIVTQRMRGNFIDTAVFLGLLGSEKRATTAERCLLTLPISSVLVLNEVYDLCVDGGALTPTEAREYTGGLRGLCRISDVTVTDHDVAWALSVKYGLQFRDALIAACALSSGSDRMLSDRLPDGTILEDVLTIESPFKSRG